MKKAYKIEESVAVANAYVVRAMLERHLDHTFSVCLQTVCSNVSKYSMEVVSLLSGLVH